MIDESRKSEYLRSRNECIRADIAANSRDGDGTGYGTAYWLRNSKVLVTAGPRIVRNSYILRPTVRILFFVYSGGYNCGPIYGNSAIKGLFVRRVRIRPHYTRSRHQYHLILTSSICITLARGISQHAIALNTAFIVSHYYKAQLKTIVQCATVPTCDTAEYQVLAPTSRCTWKTHQSSSTLFHRQLSQ